MTPPSQERWERIEALLEEALDLDAEARGAFLGRACAGDTDLRDHVKRLLKADADAPPFLEAGAADFAVPMVPDVQEDTGDTTSSERIGQRFGAWRVVEEVGRGGMGVVYRAERADVQFEQTVALKLIKRGMDTDAILARFLNERSVLASLDHHHIARIYDGGVTEEGAPWFAMEYVEGLPITVYCNENDLSLDERLEMFGKVCRAVRHAHNRLIIHRDLKPSNILVTKKGEPRLLDFGLAKVLRENGSGETTGPGRRWMTLEYASPEQVQAKTLTTASDTYQLGLILYELLAGTRPYTVRGLSPTEAERVICETPPTRPSAAGVWGDGAALTPQASRVRRRLKGDLDTIILKALHKDPERRYASAEALETDLERYRKGLPILARADTTGYRIRKFVRRHRVGVAAAAAVVLSLIGGLGAALWQANEASLERDRAQHEAEKAQEVISYLTELFESSDPDKVAGEVVTARILLERGVDHAEALEDQPEIQAEMLLTMGLSYNGLGDLEQAELLYRRALSLLESLHDGPDPALARTLRVLGLLLRQRAEFDEAGEHLRRALAMHRALYGNEHRLVAANLDNLGFLLSSQGHYAHAEQLHREALSINRKLLGPAHERIVVSLSNLGETLEQQENLDAAEPLYREALAMTRELSGEDHRRVGGPLFMLGNLLVKKGEYVEAERHLRRVLVIFLESYGERHIAYANALRSLGDVLRAQGRFDQARSHLNEALAIYRDSGSDPGMAGTLYRLGLLQFDQGAYDNAESHFMQALATLPESYPEDHPVRREWYQSLVELYEAWGKSEAAAEFRARLEAPETTNAKGNGQ